MQEKLDRLRELIQASLKSDPPLFKSVNDLSVKADVDTASLWRFLKAEPGSSSKTSFVFATKLLYAIGGRILFPDEREEDMVKMIQSMPQGQTMTADTRGYELAIRELRSLVIQLFESMGRQQPVREGANKKESLEEEALWPQNPLSPINPHKAALSGAVYFFCLFWRLPTKVIDYDLGICQYRDTASGNGLLAQQDTQPKTKGGLHGNQRKHCDPHCRGGVAHACRAVSGD